MKKLIAMFFIGLLLFNIGGHLALHQYFSYRTDKFYDQQVANNKYNVHDLTEVVIPLNQPYISNEATYEDVAGRVNFAEASYNYVKMKVTSTGIYLMCVPNYDTTHLLSNNVIDAKTIKDFPVQKKDHVPFGKMTLITYSYHDIQHFFAAPVITTFKSETAYNRFPIPESVIESPCQPPDAITFLS